MTVIHADTTKAVQQISFGVTGLYNVLLTGGFYFNDDNNFHIELVNLKTNEQIRLKRPKLRVRTRSNGERAMKYASVDIPSTGVFELRINGFENLKNSILPEFLNVLEVFINPVGTKSTIGLNFEK